jgi:ribosomal protein S18 acetylase RimI-like enzyme
MSLTITPCRPEEAEALAALVNGAYRGIDGVGGWTSEIAVVAGLRATPAMLAADLADSAVTILGLREGDALLACVRLERVPGQGGAPACLIGMLAVHPGQQDRGLGRFMLERAEQEALGWGIALARMSVVSVRDSLIAWYERRGYRRTGEIEAFPYEDDRFGTPLRPDLAFVMLEKPLPG